MFHFFLLLLLPGPVHLGRVLGGVLEEEDEDGLVLLEDHVRHRKVPLQTVNLVPERRVQVGHVRPLLGLVEELDQAQLARPQQPCERDAVVVAELAGVVGGRGRGDGGALDLDLALGVVARHVERAGKPVELVTL